MKTSIIKLIENIDKKLVSSKDYFHIIGAEKQLLYINLKIYKKSDLVLPTGEIIASGSIIGEIHVDNQKIKNMELGFKDIVSILKNELDCLALSLETDPRLYNVRAFYGRTILYSLLKRENFIILEIDRSLKIRIVEIWTKLLRLVYSQNAIRQSSRQVKEFWITQESLSKRKNL